MTTHESLREAGIRVAAVMGGGDWYDASVDFLIAPANFDFDAAHERHDEWYRTAYLTQPQFKPGQANPHAIEYMSFPEWLVHREGLRRASDDEVVEVWERP